MELHSDFKDILQAFADEQVEYLVIGGYAVGFHARPRFTKDLDLWIAGTPENLRRVKRALIRFGAPDEILDALASAQPGEIVWLGAPPVRVDIMTDAPGGDFDSAYHSRVVTNWGEVAVSVIGKAQLIELKRAAGRPQDLLDVAELTHADV